MGKGDKKKSSKKKSKDSTPKSKKGKGDGDDAKSVASLFSGAPPGSVASATAAGGAGAGAGAGAAGSSASANGGGAGPTAFFDAGQLFERYDYNRSGTMDKDSFQRMFREMGLRPRDVRTPGGTAAAVDPPTPRTGFGAGQLFERYATDFGSRMTRQEFERFMWDYSHGMLREPLPSQRGMYGGGAGRYNPSSAYPVAAPLPPPPTFDAVRQSYAQTFGPRPAVDKFEVGRLFERYNREQGGGGIDAKAFEKMLQELKHAAPARAPAPPAPTGYSMTPHYDAPAAPYYPAPVEPPAPGLPSNYLSNYYGNNLSTMVSQLTAMSAQLSMKREKIAHQLGSLQLRREHVKAARRAIERETTTDTEAILHRLRSAEAFKLSLLQHDMDELSGDMESINAFQAALEYYQPNSGGAAPGPTMAVEFARNYPMLCGEADRLVDKPIKTRVDVSYDDFDRETAVRLQALQQLQGMEELVAEKDRMIMQLVREKEAAADDMDQVSRASKDELSLWARLTRDVTEQLEKLKMVCSFCRTPLRDTTVNTDCPVNSRHAAPAAQGEVGGSRQGGVLDGTGRHHFVSVGGGGGPGSYAALTDYGHKAARGSGASAGGGGGSGGGRGGGGDVVVTDSSDVLARALAAQRRHDGSGAGAGAGAGSGGGGGGEDADGGATGSRGGASGTHSPILEVDHDEPVST